MDGKKSREALLEFLDYLSRKGLMNKATASARKAAANMALGILDEDEARDVTTIDIDQLFVRFANISGSNYKPESLNVYKGRVRSALDDFRNYLSNPLTFRPSVQANGRKSGDRPKVADQPKPVQSTDGARSEIEQPRYVTQIVPPPASVSILPIPIRADLTIQVQGLPFDLTVQEANKIANVIKAMASTE